MKTSVIKKSDIDRKWYLIDATGLRLGKLASFAAMTLQGKNSPHYSPNVDCGDHIVVVNAENIDISKKRMDTKSYWRHSGYPGGLKKVTLNQMMKEHPERVVEKAVKGMLPHTKLGRRMIKKLHVFKGEKHDYDAQKPERIEIE